MEQCATQIVLESIEMKKNILKEKNINTSANLSIKSYFGDQRILCYFRIKRICLVCSVVPVSVFMGTGLVRSLLLSVNDHTHWYYHKHRTCEEYYKSSLEDNKMSHRQ